MAKDSAKKNEYDKRWHRFKSEEILQQKKANKQKITPEEYNSLYKAQQGKCKICKTHQFHLDLSLVADYCHTSQKVRGLLCSNCNAVIRSLNDNLNLLEKIKDYLIQSQNDNNEFILDYQI